MEILAGIAFWILVCFGGCKLLENTMTHGQEQAVENAIGEGTDAAVEQLEKAREGMNKAFKGPRKAAEDFRKNNDFANWLKANGG